MGFDDLGVTALFMAAKKLPLFRLVTCVDDEKINKAHQRIYTLAEKV